MWRIGFFFHEMAFGLLSIFIPLYIVSLEGSLFDVGLMTCIATLLTIPASYVWGHICDKTAKYKLYILISFLTLSTILYLFTFTKDIVLFMVLYCLMAVFHVAHEPPKNVLIAELYSREDWEHSFAFYEGLTEVGSLIGLILGIFVSLIGFNSGTILLVCSGLNLLAFILSLFLVSDPPLVFERSLVHMERNIDFTCRGARVASKVLDGLPFSESLDGENLALFCGGLALFAFATSTLFTPLPIFLSQNLHLATGMVYTIYVLNSAAGTLGYFLSSKRCEVHIEKIRLQKAVICRSALVFLLAIFTILDVKEILAFAMILALMGFAYAIYHICALSLSMELIPAGKAGLFDALIGLGNAAGAFIGPLIAQTFNFTYTFIMSGAAFLMAYISFKAS